MDWFLYDKGLHHERVKSKNSSAANYLLFRGKPLTIITKRSILNVAAALDPPLNPDKIRTVREKQKTSRKYYERICFSSCKRLLGDYTHLLSMRKDVNAHTTFPEKVKILTSVEVSFVSGHYDLTVIRLNMQEKGIKK